MADVLSIVGSSRINGNREENDFYPTPGYVTQALLDREKFYGKIWEPACGDGAMSELFIKNGYTDVFSSDLVNRGYGEYPLDFLKSDRITCNNIITNPPFKDALQFVIKSKEAASDKVAMFLKTVFLESEGRRDMFLDKDFPLKTVYQFCKRVSLYKGGEKLKNSGTIAYAWYVWDKNYDGKPQIEWI